MTKKSGDCGEQGGRRRGGRGRAKLLVSRPHGHPHQGELGPGCTSAGDGPRIRLREAEGMEMGGCSREAEEGWCRRDNIQVREEMGQLDAAVQEGAPVPGESGKQDFFKLTGKERSAHGFNFTMDRAVYEEIKGSTEKSHTIHPKNVADTGGSGGAQLLSGCSGRPGSVGNGDPGTDDNEEDGNSTKGSSPTMGSTGGFGKRKNVRQQTFEALTECVEKHGTLMATTVESASKRQCSIQIRQCKAMEAEVEVQRKHYAASDDVNKLMCQALLKIVKAIRERRAPVAEVVWVLRRVDLDEESTFRMVV
ncbi:hypothetical protein CBR_g3499, partial [Chara braunii]